MSRVLSMAGSGFLRETCERWSDFLRRNLEPRLSPGLEHSQFRYADMVRRELARSRVWLDIGCGHEFLPSWIPEQRRQLDLSGRCCVGIDPDRASLERHQALDWKVCGFAEHLPFAGKTFDLVTANTVLEHVADPERLFAEVHRVLSGGGRLVVHTPNAHGYTTLLTRAVPSRARTRLAGLLHERAAADVYPTFYRANTPAALQEIAGKTGFSVVDLRVELTLPSYTWFHRY